ncbi:MAG: RHS repeat-associated core domain-containing protein, partial [Deltaproteobacteria bacterium]|nr:RHS repeat-associated core domain-containing protein [Deltaproteobacteria bacterium]
SETIRNAYTFTGREYDSETGLYYYRARYYDPEAGRFIGKDPIGFAGGDVNVYGYVGNNSVNWTDVFGLKIDLSEAGRLKKALKKLKSTKRGKQLYEIMKKSEITYKIIDKKILDAYYDPSAHEIIIDPEFHPEIKVKKGCTEKIVQASSERILGHEMGHAATGVGDTGPDRMDNVRLNENPIAIELGQDERLEY